MNTGARVTYAMGKDDEAPEHFGILHAESLSPREAPSGRWLPSLRSSALSRYPWYSAMPARPLTQRSPHCPTASSPTSAISSHDQLAALPNSLLTVTLTSNFGTFILYALSCLLAIVAYHRRPDFNVILHLLIPGFGLLGQHCLHGLLPDQSGLWLGNIQGTTAGTGHLRRLGYLRSHLLPSNLEGEGQSDPP